MKDLLKVCILDPEIFRRNQICLALLEEGIFAEPCSSVEDLMIFWPKDALLFVADLYGLLEDVILANFRAEQSLPIVAYSEAPESMRVMNAAREGIAGYLTWPATGLMRPDLEAAFAILTTNSDENRETAAAKLVKTLSSRESDVLDLLSQGQINKEIARDLGISSRTVEAHRATMMRRLDVNCAVAAAKIWQDASRHEARLRLVHKSKELVAKTHAKRGYHFFSVA